MRIGQFSDSFLPILDGVGRVVESYARTMGEMGEAVTVFAPKDEMGDISMKPYEVVTYNTVPMPGKKPYRIGLPQLDIPFEREIHGIPLDIMHVHSPFMMGRVGLSLGRRQGVPVIGTFHSKFYDDFSRILKVDALARTGVKYVVNFFDHCDEVWAVSATTADTLKEYGYTGEVIVMPNGTDIRPLDETVLPELRERFAIHPGEPMLLYAGQLDWKKNIRRTLEAAAILRAEGQPFRLVLAGQGSHREDIAREGEAMGIADRMVFAGHVQSTRELDGLYALADLFVFPSLYDNAPMVLREAAVMKTPAVLVEGSSSAEGITDGVNGLLCKDEPSSLAAAIRRGLENPDLLVTMGENARATIPVSWDQLVGQVLERYRMLVEKNKVR